VPAPVVGAFRLPAIPGNAENRSRSVSPSGMLIGMFRYAIALKPAVAGAMAAAPALVSAVLAAAVAPARLDGARR
jgi:hypothetical protein